MADKVFENNQVSLVGECMEDGYYYESDYWADVSEKMEEHELTI